MNLPRAEQENQLLHDLVAHYSPSGAERPATEFLRGVFQRWGWNASIDEAGNVVGELGSGSPTICFLGHIDTVKGKIAVRREGNLLFGRGAVDAKGPLAAAACAAARLPRGLAKKIVLVGAVGEESPGSPGASHFVHRLRPDFALIGEPSRWDRVTIGYKGNLSFTYARRAARVHGAAEAASVATTAALFFVRHCLESGAGCRPAKGGQTESAPHSVSPHPAPESADVPPGRSPFDSLLAGIRTINTERGEFEERVEMSVDLRLPPAIHPDEVERRLRAEAGDAVITVVEKLPTVVCDKNSRLVRTLVAAIREHGGTPRFVKKTGTSDLNVVAPVWQCPLAAYGPGDSNLDHTPNEHLDLDEYQRAIGVLETLFLKL